MTHLVHIFACHVIIKTIEPRDDLFESIRKRAEGIFIIDFIFRKFAFSKRPHKHLGQIKCSHFSFMFSFQQGLTFSLVLQRSSMHLHF